MRKGAHFVVGLVMMGCGGSAVVQPPLGAPAAKVEAAQPVAAGARTASEEIRRHWPLGDDNQFVLYGDLEAFVKTELVSGLVPSLLALGKASMSDVQRECVRTFIDAVREIAIGANEDGPLVLARFDETTIKPKPSTCIQSVASGRPIELAGAIAAFSLDNDVVALQPGLLVFGTKKMVSESLKGGGSGRWPSGLDLPKDTHLSWRTRMPEEKVAASGTVASSNEFLRLDVKADFETEQDATELESKIAQGRKALAGRIAAEPSAKMAMPLVEALRVARDGRTLAFTFELREPPVDQARDVGILAGVAISGVRKYLLAAKLGEARSTLTSIARGEVDAWRDLPPGKRKLSSLPPVPKEVPHGMKYQSAPGDWKRWEAVKFAMNGPQYFQYEVVASKDGKRADIIARGDLNGDGKSSELTLKVKVNPKGNVLEVGPQIEEKDPEE